MVSVINRTIELMQMILVFARDLSILHKICASFDLDNDLLARGFNFMMSCYL